MPVEIRELVIRAVVDPPREGPGASSPAKLTQEEREAMIEECVKEVLRILRAAKER